MAVLVLVLTIEVDIMGSKLLHIYVIQTFETFSM